MTLNEYIAQSSTRPNRACLEALGASEDLIKYMMDTPENTNLNIVEQLNTPEVVYYTISCLGFNDAQLDDIIIEAGESIELPDPNSVFPEPGGWVWYNGTWVIQSGACAEEYRTVFYHETFTPISDMTLYAETET